MAGEPGFEPGLTESESVGLPLTYSPMPSDRPGRNAGCLRFLTVAGWCPPRFVAPSTTSARVIKGQICGFSMRGQAGPGPARVPAGRKGCRQKEFGDLAASCYSRANDKIEKAPAAAERSLRGADGQASERPRFRPAAVRSGCAGCGTKAGAEQVPARQAEAQEGRASAHPRSSGSASCARGSGTPKSPEWPSRQSIPQAPAAFPQARCRECPGSAESGGEDRPRRASFA